MLKLYKSLVPPMLKYWSLKKNFNVFASIYLKFFKLSNTDLRGRSYKLFKVRLSVRKYLFQ